MLIYLCQFLHLMCCTAFPTEILHIKQTEVLSDRIAIGIKAFCFIQQFVFKMINSVRCVYRSSGFVSDTEELEGIKPYKWQTCKKVPSITYYIRCVFQFKWLEILLEIFIVKEMFCSNSLTLLPALSFYQDSTDLRVKSKRCNSLKVFEWWCFDEP